MKLSLEQFIVNVQQWSTDRGIYKHSNPYSQTLKAVSEFGEVCDAVAKKNIEELKDGLGDVVTCLINVAWFGSEELEAKRLEFFITSIERWDERRLLSSAMYSLSELIDINSRNPFAHLQQTIACIYVLAGLYDISMEECYHSVWEIISKRTGKMIEGGVFVKDTE